MKLFKKRNLPVHLRCRNCTTAQYGRYCHFCGQDLFAGKERSALKVAYLAIENAFSLDNKLFGTLWRLILRPGYLSSAYFQGQINRYVHPAKLFWFISILFFALLIGQLSSTLENEKRNGEKSTPTPKHTEQTTENNAVQSSVEQSRKPVKIDREGIKDIDEIIKYTQSVSGKLPFAGFLLIPLFAGLMWVFFYRRAYRYVDHFIFSLHFHAFVFLLLSLYLILYDYVKLVKGHIEWLLLLPFIYFLIAIRHFYRPRVVGMIFKSLLISLLYCIILFTTTLGLGLLGYYIMNPQAFD